MNKVHFYLLRVEEEIMKYFHCIRFYHSKYGLKNIGASCLVGGEKSIATREVIFLNDLYLGPDYLKDDYTLLGCPINESPHFAFIKAIFDGKDILNTDYIRRYLNGSLDWRRGTILPRNRDFFYNKFSLALGHVQSNDYAPVMVYSLNGKFYLYDGKHRAALCSLLGLPIKCTIVSDEIVNTGLWHYMFSLLNGNVKYSKHILFHEEYLKECK